MHFAHFEHYPNRVNIVLDIARGKTTGFNENDRSEIAEFIQLGIVKKTGDELSMKLPIFTSKQYEALLSLIDDLTTTISEETRELCKIATDALIQHTPVAMKKEAESLGWLKMFDAVQAPLKIMMDNDILRQIPNPVYPTTYIWLA